MMRKKSYFKKLKSSVLVMMGLVISPLVAQESVNTSGGNASGSGGSISWSIGQVVYQSYSNAEISIIEGVQQPFEFSGEILGVPDIRLLDVKVYPNPTSDILTFNFGDYDTSEVKYALYDITGKLIFNWKTLQNNNSISLKELVMGVYFLKLFRNNKTAKLFKIIKN